MVPARCLWASMGHPSRPRVSTSAVDGTAVMRRRGRLRLLMTLMYGPAVHRKRFSSICRLAVLHQCIRPLIGAVLCSGPSWISARLRSHYRTGLERRGWVIVVERGPTGSNREEPDGSAEGGSLRAVTRAG